MQSYIEEIASFCPGNVQEASDRDTVLWYIRRFGDQVLLRDNLVAHITSSGFLMNPALDKALMVHHNIRDTWAWTGGHADGDRDLLSVALREAREETGITQVRPLSTAIASIDILPVYGHMRRGQYVSAHLHLSVAYILICPEGQALHIKPDENTGVRWFAADAIAAPSFAANDAALYGKLMRWAKAHKTTGESAGGL